MDLGRLKMLFDASNKMDVTTIVFYLVVAFVLTTIVFLVYKITYSGVAYSNNFNISVVLTGMITAMIMMVIGNNLALSLGMVGALSIVRFRAAIKEPKDISYLFLSVAIGLSVGTGALKIAVIGTIFISCVILLYKLLPNFNQHAYLLIIKGGAYDEMAVLNVLKNFTKKNRLRMKNTKKDTIETIYEIRLSINEEILIRELYKIGQIEQVNIVTFDGQLNE